MYSTSYNTRALFKLCCPLGVTLRSGSCAQGSNTCGGGKSDPVMTGFTGRSFNFFGDVGKTYNLISSQNHQVRHPLCCNLLKFCV